MAHLAVVETSKPLRPTLLPSSRAPPISGLLEGNFRGWQAGIPEKENPEFAKQRLFDYKFKQCLEDSFRK